jgi:hypothetical protein
VGETAADPPANTVKTGPPAGTTATISASPIGRRIFIAPVVALGDDPRGKG